MKRILLPILIACTLAFCACTDYKAQIEDLQGKIDRLNANLEQLDPLAANLGALRDVLVIEQAGDPVVGVAPSGNAFAFSFKNNGEVTVEAFTAGISVASDGSDYYWTLGGSPLKDASGNNALIKVTPKFRASEDKVEVSTDGGSSWTQVNMDATQAVISKVEESASSIDVTFLGGTTVRFEKEAVLSVMLSGDGSTMASTGTAVVDFMLQGPVDDYSVTPQVSEGWKAEVRWENDYKGSIVFTAPAASTDKARVYFCDAYGRAVVSDIDFATLTVDEEFPVMYPAWDAYNISYEGGSVEATIYANLEEFTVGIDPDCDWLWLGGSKTVIEHKVSFAAGPNDSDQMRSAVIEIASGKYVQKMVIWQNGKPAVSGEDLSANGTANCYIVSEEGDYYFTATVAGNGDEGILPSVSAPTTDFPASSELSPVSAAIELNQNDVISDVRLQDGKIYFHASGDEGNATITIKNSRNYIVWSWHIWCTDVPEALTHSNPDQIQFTVLDRNIGATSAEPDQGDANLGMFYQWGRKDPFVATTTVWYTNSSHAFAFGSRYPSRPYREDGNADSNWYNTLNDYLWGNPEYGKNLQLKDLKKTIFDPCPVGYMVPPANTFLIFSDTERLEQTAEGVIVRGDYGQLNYYPYAGMNYCGIQYRGQAIYQWNSCAARYGVHDNGGASCTVLNRETGTLSMYNGIQRSRCLPVRCVKQVTE